VSVGNDTGSSASSSSRKQSSRNETNVANAQPHQRSRGVSPVTAFAPPAAAVPAVAAAQTEWRKALYERQPFEDNYVDPIAFMQHLRTNENLRNLRFADIARDTLAVVQQLSIMVLFVVVFANCVQGTLTLTALFLLDTTLVIVALLAHAAASKTFTIDEFLGYVKDFFLMTSVLLLLSPIFHTMTKSYSDDTIWALSILLAGVHLIFADYDYVNAYPGTHYTQNVSMNSAVIGVVLLASRLDTPIIAAALIGFGVLCFTLSPKGRHYVKANSDEAHQAVTFMLVGIAIGFLVQLKPLLAATFIAAVGTLSLVMPFCFVKVQSSEYKVQIQGPWDEAKPTNSAAAAEWANAGLLS
jgi:phosphatidylinositol glycan class C protein